MSQDPELRAHQEWLGYLQPVGLVVSPAALRDSQAHVNKNIVSEQEILISLAEPAGLEFGKRGEEPPKRIRDFPALAQKLLAWEPTDLAGGPGAPKLPSSLEAPLADYGEVLKPTYAVPDPANAGGWLILVKELKGGTPLDDVPETETHDKRWQASPQARFERLLRENQVPIGILTNGDAVRLVYAPRGESAGHLTFPVSAMCEVPGRPILAALHMLLSAERLFVLPTEQRLPALLQKSRKYQNEVSTKLAEQVLRALNELMRGFQSANEATQGELLRQVLHEAPEEAYGGLLTTLMRLVFILYAEDRGLLSTEPFYVDSYSISGLFERLREDAAQFPDTMDQRFGAWAQILTLSRLIHDGGGHGTLNLPARRGRLFDPDAYPFVEGRPFQSKRSPGEAIYPPRVSDGVVFRVLQDLLLLDGDRLSYRSLDVEQIGSVYEAMMGFVVQTAVGPSIGLKPDHVVVNLTELLSRSAAERPKWLKEHAFAEVTGRALQQLKNAENVDDLAAAFGRKISSLYLDAGGLPLVISAGGMYLQPTEERRRSGSHYTPRSLTEPIVRTTLHPVLVALGEKPLPEQILSLRICDPAMGSGAFLVEACRYLAEALVESWTVHGDMPVIPADQDPILHARRLVAQRCLYGVDKNPFAVNLAKLSLWLATLAKDHPFTFLDHALRTGDSLVGFNVRQISYFHWCTEGQKNMFGDRFESNLELVLRNRAIILEAPDSVPYETQRQRLARADEYLVDARMAADVLASAYFSEDKPREREQRRTQLGALVRRAFDAVTDMDAESDLKSAAEKLRSRDVKPFHWELEFPEVFRRAGFNAIVGNPPFLGGRRISTAFGKQYFSYLLESYPGARNLCDLVAYFYRRAFSLLGESSTLGLVATKTISQGDTRTGGLAWICDHGGRIYGATRRLRWPGRAAVIVSIIHIARGQVSVTPALDGKLVDRISAFLLDKGGDSDPAAIEGQSSLFSSGSKIYGQGFLFDDEDEKASPLAEMHRVVAKSGRNKDRIYPYIGGEEINSDAQPLPRRYAIYFSDLSSEEELNHWPELASIVRERVRPEREALPLNPCNLPLRRKWWAYQAHRPDFYAAAHKLERVLAISEVTAHIAFSFLPTSWMFSHRLILFLLQDWPSFAVLQSRIHEVFARCFASSLGETLMYSGTSCFAPFPFPESWTESEELAELGRRYYEFRSFVMVSRKQGLTVIYNRFHDPEESAEEIVELRRMHEALDRVVLDAYGWNDLRPACEFLLDQDDDPSDEIDRRRRRPWRFRWPDEVHDQILARLLELNRSRTEISRVAGAATEITEPRKRARKASIKVKASEPGLFSFEETSDETQ